MPIEYFPPAVNMARYFAARNQWKVSICTNRNHLGRKDFSDPSLELVRGTYPAGLSGFGRFFAYLSFHSKSFLHILKTKPDVILYIEPHSALPAFLGRLVFCRPGIFIHYHEFHTPEDFSRRGMRMASWFHKLEKWRLYPIAAWVSQTNESRMSLFLEDNPEVQPSKAQILPNYPPANWWNGDNRAWVRLHENNGPIRFVYVGSLSRAETFIEEAVAWVQHLGAEIATLDIYSYNLHEETRSWLHGVAHTGIRFHEQGVDYDDLPELLRDFHVGLILYKGNTPNYIHNASNKLFEYLACGLDVLYPRQMVGVKPYACTDRRPRVIECEFEDMDGFTYEAEGRMLLPPNRTQFHCEAEMSRLEEAMLKVTGKAGRQA